MSNKGRVSNSTTTDTEDAKCCSNCDIDGGYAKYYSIAKIQDTCGECCMLPEDFKKYKLFEPGLKVHTIYNIHTIGGIAQRRTAALCALLSGRVVVSTSL